MGGNAVAVSVGGGRAVEGSPVDPVGEAAIGVGGGGVVDRQATTKIGIKSTGKMRFKFQSYFSLSSRSIASASTISSSPSTISILLVNFFMCSSTTSGGQNSMKR